MDQIINFEHEDRRRLRTQPCPVCSTPMGDMPGSRDAYCPSCGYKDPCCE